MMAQVIGKRGMATRSSIETILHRVEKLVDAETAALRSRAAINLKEITNGKSQALLEFSLAIRSLDGAALDTELTERLKLLRRKLETNRSVLQMHLEAVREIASVVADSIKDAEWDGTYSQRTGPGSSAR